MLEPQVAGHRPRQVRGSRGRGGIGGKIQGRVETAPRFLTRQDGERGEQCLQRGETRILRKQQERLVGGLVVLVFEELRQSDGGGVRGARSVSLGETSLRGPPGRSP